jgi:CBS domain-containing protein
MLVLDVMSTEVRTLSPDTPPNEVMRIMDEHKIRHLPVVENGELIGVVSDRDLLTATGWFPSDSPDRAREVRAIMHTPVKTLDPQDQLVTASLQMILHVIGCMPVVDGKRLVGIVTDIDLLRGFLNASLDGALSGEHNPPVSRLMSARASCVEPNATLVEARNRMQQLRIHHLPVVAGDELKGMLSDRDLRWAEGRSLPDETPVEDFMSDFVVTIQPEHLVTAAASSMLEHRFGALPVVDDGRLVGILTATDLLDHCMQTLWEPESAPPAGR